MPPESPPPLHPIEGIFITFERGRGLNFRVKFLVLVRVRVEFFRRR